jgi:sigma-B regulation protein RsbQ
LFYGNTGLFLIMDALQKNNVRITGKTDSPQTLVFGHGFGTDQTAWRFITDSFRNDYRIITYDNVGAGGTNPDLYNHSRYARLHTYADDLVALAEALNIEQATFIGHSVSCMVGLLASKKNPSLFGKHVFLNASPRYLNDDDDNYIGGFTQQALNDLFAAMANNYYAWVSGFAPVVMGNPEKPQFAEEFARTLSALRPDIALAVAKAIFGSDHRADLSGFNKETLIIQSSSDVAVPLAVGKYLNEHLPDSRLQVIEASGHFPHISVPSDVVRSIKSFI